MSSTQVPRDISQLTDQGAILRNQGWSLISSVVANLSAAVMRTPAAMFPGATTKNGIFARVNEVSSRSVPWVRVIVGNWYGNAQPNGAMPAFNDIFWKSSFYNKATSEAYKVLWGGIDQATVHSRQIVVSDPVRFPVASGVPYDVLHYASVAAPSNSLPSVLTLGVIGAGDQPNGTEGAWIYDITGAFLGNNVHTNGSVIVPSHQGILGFTGPTPAKSLGMLGDSIMAGTGDVGVPYRGIGGYGVRIALQQFGVSMTWPQPLTASFGYVNSARGGDTIAHFLTVGASKCQIELASFATTVLSDFGINDVVAGSDLATLKANTLALAAIVAGNNQKFIACTLTPQTTSTDGWTTVANQTITVGSVRTGYNSWLRDTSASGFVAQAAAATGLPPVMFGAFDVAAAVEVNAANVLTLNGGYWRAATATPVYSGTVTTGGSISQLTDTSFVAALNQYRGYSVRWKTGSNAGANACIYSNTAAGVIATNGNTNSYTIGDTYDIVLDLPTVDGTHPTPYSHDAIARSFPISLIA